MADSRCSCTIMVGGEGSSLTPSSVFDVANNARLRIHPSALQSLPPHALGDRPFLVVLPDFFTAEQARAALLVVLNKLLPISSPSILSILDILNSASDSVPPFTITGVTAEETNILESCLDSLEGVCAIICHKTSSLCAIADIIAALSCEASRVYLSAFITARCEDASMLVPRCASRSVVLEFLLLLNGSKLVNENHVDGVHCIPRVHGSLKEVQSKLQSTTRVTLNSARMETTKETWILLLSNLMVVLSDYGKGSLNRARFNVESVRDDTTRSLLRRLITEQCPTGECLDGIVGEALSEQYARFLHLVDKLVGHVSTILSWEMTTALASLEPAELHLGGEGVNDGGPEKRSLMGFKTGAVMVFIEDRLKHIPLGGPDLLARLRKLAGFCGSVLTPTEKECQNFARILKIPKDMPYSMVFQPYGVRLNRGGIISANLKGNVVGLVEAGAETPSSEIHCEGGYAISTDVPLVDTYQKGRYGRFQYHFALSSGSYSVGLYFAETLNVEHRDGIRVFDVRINGKNVLSGFDIGRDFGFLTPCGLFDYLVELKDGDEGLVIDFDPQVGSALANVICVRKLPGYFGWWTSNPRVMCEFCEQEIDVPIEVAAQIESDLRGEYDIKLKQYKETLERETLDAMLEKDEGYKKYYEQKIKETYDFFEESRKKGKEYMEALKKGLADVKAVGLGSRDILKELEEIDKIRAHA